MAAAVLVLAWLAAGCAGPPPHAIETERGDVALRLGELEDAADAYSRALVYRSEDPAALLGLARCRLAQGEPEAALDLLARLHASDAAYFADQAASDYRTALYEAARQSLRRGDPSRALARIRSLQRIDPGHPGLAALQAEALLAEGARLELAGRREEAEAAFRKALGSRASGPGAALAQAQALLEAGRIDAAISILSDALLRHPGEPRLEWLMDRALRIRYPNRMGGADSHPEETGPGSGETAPSPEEPEEDRP